MSVALYGRVPVGDIVTSEMKRLLGNAQGCVRIPIDFPVALREGDTSEVHYSDPGPNRVWNGKVVKPFSDSMLMTDVPISMWAPRETVSDPKDNTGQKVIINGHLPNHCFDASKIKIGDPKFRKHLISGEFIMMMAFFAIGTFVSVQLQTYIQYLCLSSPIDGRALPSGIAALQTHITGNLGTKLG